MASKYSKYSKYSDLHTGVATKRERSRNFSIEEKELLVEILLKRIEIIETKKCDHLTYRAKELAWRQITKDYNARASSPRSRDCLKMCWRNMKKKLNKLCTEETKSIFETSGECIDMESDQLLYKIKGILSGSIDDLHKLNDSGTTQYNKGSDTNMSVETDEDAILEEDTAERSTNSRDLALREPAEEKKTSKPYVLTLSSSEMTEEEEKIPGNTKTIPHLKKDISPYLDVINSKEIVRLTSKKLSKPLQNFADVLAESKLELAQLAKEHAIAEEKRKLELHKLHLQEAKLKVEILKLELAEKQSELINNS